MKRLTIQGNTKLGNKTGVFNLPARETCTPTEWCLRGLNGKPRCYGLRNNCAFRSVVEACKERLRESKKQDFVERMKAEIHLYVFRFFRIHSTGDFYSEEYVGKWMDIVRGCPDTLFKATTRRRDLTEALRCLHEEPNIIVRESLDTERTTPVMGLPAAGIDDIELFMVADNGTDMIRCPGTEEGCEQCGHACWKDPRWVVFPVH